MKLFGTDGVRGVINQEITPKLCYNIGRTLAKYLTQNNKKDILIAKDTRTSCDMIFSCLAAGLTSLGINVTFVGITTTPALCYLTKTQNFSLGVMITASHNSAEFNGIKIFDQNGNKPNTKLEKTLQGMFDKISQEPLIAYDKIGKVIYKPKLKQKYIAYLRTLLKGVACNQKVCFDNSNGAANYILKPLLKHFDNFVVVGTDTQGINVNKNCGATCVQNLQAAIKANNCDIGFAFDGDADRIVMVKGDKVLDGDDILYILARFLREQKLLYKDCVVGTIMANFGLQEALNKQNIKLIRVPVGDKYIVDYLAQNNLMLGGEQAGHIIINNLSNTGDGVLVSIVLLKALMYYGDKFDTLLKDIKKYPQILKNISVDNKLKNQIIKLNKVQQTLNKCQDMLFDEGRVVLRASGTEPIIRIMAEGKNLTAIEHVVDILTTTITACNK